ncbi:hypothetical protein HMSSN036_45840 [Paenibacillus macerans]|nr:hypothetical protein HMSSN036_45840 [Paenibacillus macerans]
MKSLLTRPEETARDFFAEAALRQERETPENEVEFRLHLRRPRFMEQRKATPPSGGRPITC